MFLNISAFNKLQGEISNRNMANKLGISRTQLWRIKNGSSVGEKFISKFMIAYPQENIGDYFFCGTVTQN